MIKLDDRAPLIWISCLDRERTIKEIQNVWNISSPNYLYRGNMASKMAEEKLLKIVRIESKNIFYKSIQDGLPKIIKNPSEKLTRAFKDWNVLSKWIFNEHMLNKFFSLDKILVLCQNNAETGKKNGYDILFNVSKIIFVVNYMCEKSKKDNTLTDKIIGDFVNFAAHSAEMYNNECDYHSYFLKVGLTLDDLNSIPKDVKMTTFYKQSHDQMDSFLKIEPRFRTNWFPSQVMKE